ncbi:MAG TPA: hypothetical protein PKM16_10165 [Bacteroidia bacterium]|nr:hypothetical protein [Bacteroidia bacterium]
MLKVVTLISLFLLSSSTFAQTTEECPCCKDEYKEFDFWLGEWEVFDVEGKKVGNSQISKSERNCILFEKWTSVGDHTGSSINFFDQKNYEWNQVWVDNNGLILKLKGGLIANGIIQMSSELLQNDQGLNFKNSIRWTLQEDGTVKQQWDMTDENLESFKTLFIGIYKAKKP